MAPPFKEARLTVEVPIITGETLYTRRGDFLGTGFALAAVLLLLFGAVGCIIQKHEYQKKNTHR
jgi:apolipoprotein N-acyltransferase